MGKATQETRSAEELYNLLRRTREPVHANFLHASGVVLEGAGWLKSGDLLMAEKFRLQALQPCSPELNPILQALAFLEIALLRGTGPNSSAPSEPTDQGATMVRGCVKCSITVPVFHFAGRRSCSGRFSFQ